ncbi:MAG: SAM-dependent methyltransferase [Candidatus Acidiferrales bacterium]
MSVRPAKTPLHDLLVERIRARGPITFAEYMETCLYHPEFGYYSGTTDRCRADYYTSVDVSPVFGRLLARQLHEMWTRLGRPEPFIIVEGGAAAGALARQILDFARALLPEFYAVLRYWAVEVSKARRVLQSAALAEHLAAGRAFSTEKLPETIAEGCIFSNELLDALPVHRVVMRRGELREIYVDAEGDRLVERALPESSAAVGDYFNVQGVQLQEEQEAEAGLAACHWIEEAGERLGRGFVLTIDYGREARELYDEHHVRGTMLAYSRHRASEDFYRAPGEQDLTAHVSWTALDRWGHRSGLARTGLASQTNFLLAIARANDFADLGTDDPGETGQVRARLLFQNLIHPEGMGEMFQVMAQHKGIAVPNLTGFQRF